MATLMAPIDLRQSDFRTESEHADAWIKENDDRIIKWQVADGYAYYYVESVSPPRLRWVIFGDAWSVNPALIRGLRSAEIQAILDSEAMLKSFFGGRA